MRRADQSVGGMCVCVCVCVCDLENLKNEAAWASIGLLRHKKHIFLKY